MATIGLSTSSRDHACDIHVVNPTTAITHVVTMDDAARVQNLKGALKEHLLLDPEGSPIAALAALSESELLFDLFDLKFAGSTLEDDGATLADYGVGAETSVEVNTGDEGATFFPF